MADTAPRARRPGLLEASLPAVLRRKAMPAAASDARPVVLWTVRGSGSTALAQRTFKALPFPIVEHRPFEPGRVFGDVSALWQPGYAGPEDDRCRRLADTLVTRPLIRHCVEQFPDAFNRALAEATTRLGYRHLFMHRRRQADRLITLHRAGSVASGPADATPSLAVPEALAQAQLATHRLRQVWEALAAMNAPCDALAVEEVHATAAGPGEVARLRGVCDFLLQGTATDHAMVDRIVDEIVAASASEAQSRPDDDLPDATAVREALRWQPGFEPSRPLRVCGSIDAAAPADDATAIVPGLWLAPWSIGLRWCPTLTTPRMLLGIQHLVAGPPDPAARRPKALALETEFAARETDIRHARLRIAVVGHPVRRFVGAYARVTLAAGLLSAQRLDNLAVREPRLTRLLATLPRDPTLAEFTEYFRGYLKVPDVARLFVPAPLHLGPLSQYDRIYPEEQLDQLMHDLAALTGRPLVWPVQIAPPPRLPASQRDTATLQRIRELCADELALLQPWYGSAARLDEPIDLAMQAHSDAA